MRAKPIDPAEYLCQIEVNGAPCRRPGVILENNYEGTRSPLGGLYTGGGRSDYHVVYCQQHHEQSVAWQDAEDRSVWGCSGPSFFRGLIPSAQLVNGSR